MAFIEKECSYLLLSDSDTDNSLIASLKGFDFLTRSIFPSIHDKIYEKHSTLFSPAIPNTFHRHYVLSNRFLESIEQLFLNQEDPIVGVFLLLLTDLPLEEGNRL